MPENRKSKIETIKLKSIVLSVPFIGPKHDKDLFKKQDLKAYCKGKKVCKKWKSLSKDWNKTTNIFWTGVDAKKYIMQWNNAHIRGR